MNRQIGKLIARIAENLPDMDTDLMQKWIDDPKGLQKVLKATLCVTKKNKDVMPFKTWRTVKLGTGIKDVDGFRKALNKVDCNISDWSNYILGKPAFEQSVVEAETEVELVNVSVAELGFKGRATRADIYKRAQELGLDLCPAEVGPQLRLQYKDQPKGEWVVAMEPISDSNGDLRVFYVGRDDDGEQWLGAHFGYPDSVWAGGHRFVFVRRK